MIVSIFSFLKELLIDIPICVIRKWVDEESGYSYADIFKALFHNHPLLTIVTVIIVLAISRGQLGKLHDARVQANPDSKMEALIQKMDDKIHSATVRCFPLIAVLDKDNIEHPTWFQKVYRSFYDTETERKYRVHRYELDCRLIQQHREKLRINNEQNKRTQLDK